MQIMNISKSTFPFSAPGSARKDGTRAQPQCRAVASGQGSGAISSYTVLAVSSAPMWRSAPGYVTHMVERQWWVPTARPQGRGTDQAVRVQGWDAVPVSNTGTCANQDVEARSP